MQILDDPQTAAIIVLDTDRLTYERLTGDKLYFHSDCSCHRISRFLWRKRLRHQPLTAGTEQEKAENNCGVRAEMTTQESHAKCPPEKPVRTLTPVNPGPIDLQ